MPENSAERVRKIMERAEDFGSDSGSAPAISVWLVAFGVEEMKLNDLASAGTVAEVTRKLQLLLNEVDRAEELAVVSSIGEENYSEAFANIRSVIQPFYINNQWQERSGHFGQYDLKMLSAISNVTGDEEYVVDEASHQEFSRALEDFKEHIASLKESPLKDFAVSQASYMEQALTDYEVVGAIAFKQALKDFTGEGIVNYDIWEENEGSETIEKMKNAGFKLYDIVVKTPLMVQAGNTILQLFGE